VIERWRLECGKPMDGPPAFAVRLFVGWSSWLVGWRYDGHPREWSLELHAGPLMLSFEYVR
jgi:hypothetical protein